MLPNKQNPTPGSTGQTETDELPDVEEPDVPDESASEEGAAEEGSEAQPYLTRAEFEQGLTTFQRRVQSMLDKANNRVGRMYAAMTAQNKQALELAKASGMTDEQLAVYGKALNEKALHTALTSEEASGEQTPAPTPTDPHTVTAQGNRIADRYGLVAEDPEIALVNTNGSPQDYFASIHYAGRLRQQRLKGNGAAASTPPAKAPALGPGGKPPIKNKIKDIQSADELYNMAWLDEVKRARR